MAMAPSVDVLVVGGGVLGVSTAVHLAEGGAGSVKLIERLDLAGGTSGSGGGFIAPWSLLNGPMTSAASLAIELYSLEFYAEMAAAGYDFGYKSNGTLWLSFDAQLHDKYADSLRSDLAGAIKTEHLSALDIRDRFPVVNHEHVFGGFFWPVGAHLSAERVVRALGNRFLAAGGEIATRCPVGRLLASGGQITGVETPSGIINASAVVLATGAWTNQLLRTIGGYVPVVPLVVSRIVTEPLGLIPSLPNIMLASDPGVWLREETGSLLWGAAYQAAPHRALVDCDPPEVMNSLPRGGLPELEAIRRERRKALPFLDNYSDFMMQHGAPCETSDSHAIVGPLGIADGLYGVVGDNYAGVTHGPGLGRAAADAVLGTSTIDVGDALNPSRFGQNPPTPAEIADMPSVQESFRL